MNNIPLQKKITEIMKKDSNYPQTAYEFITEVIQFATKKQPKSTTDKNSQHIGAKKIVKNVVDFALSEYGYFATNVLIQLNIITAMDVGNIVFNLINVGLLHQSEDDSIEDFMFEFNILKSIEQRYKRYTVKSDEIPILN